MKLWCLIFSYLARKTTTASAWLSLTLIKATQFLDSKGFCLQNSEIEGYLPLEEQLWLVILNKSGAKTVKYHFSGSPSNSENLLYLKPGVNSRFLFSMPCLFDLEKVLTTLFLYFELTYLPTSFSWISSNYHIRTRQSGSYCPMFGCLFHC